LRAFPIGGFCKMRGMDEEVPDDPEAMNNKPLRSRVLVIIGGSLMNFALALLLFFALVMLRGYPMAEVRGISPGMPGYQAGLHVGQRVAQTNGQRIRV